MIRVKIILKNFGAFLILKLVKCSVDGVNYIDFKMKQGPSQYLPGEDPCNPLYWYPRNIPEYCNYRNFTILPRLVPPPIHMPLPVPIPPPQFIVPIPAVPPYLPGSLPAPMGLPISPQYPMFPLNPSPGLLPALAPFPSYPIANNPEQTGMVPGLPGLVTNDGGINILPFSDAYSDLLENHKNKMIRRRLRQLIGEYEDFPNGQTFRRLRKYARRNTLH